MMLTKKVHFFFLAQVTDILNHRHFKSFMFDVFSFLVPILSLFLIYLSVSWILVCKSLNFGSILIKVELQKNRRWGEVGGGKEIGNKRENGMMNIQYPSSLLFYWPQDPTSWASSTVPYVN
jgi:hypothetical protein